MLEAIALRLQAIGIRFLANAKATLLMRFHVKNESNTCVLNAFTRIPKLWIERSGLLVRSARSGLNEQTASRVLTACCVR